LKTYCWEF
jgi:hypothetical protein